MLGPEAEETQETFALYGLAMYEAQCAEASLALLLASRYTWTVLSRPDPLEGIRSRGIRRVLERMQRHLSVGQSAIGDADEALRAAFDEGVSFFRTQTLGKLICILRDEFGDPDGLVGSLTEALQTRNRLAHRYWWERSAEFNIAAGRCAMLDELASMAKWFESLDERLTVLIDSCMSEWGVTDDAIASAVQELMDETGLPYGGADATSSIVEPMRKSREGPHSGTGVRGF